MSFTDYSIRSFQGGYDKNLTYLVTCMRTSNQFLIDASVPLNNVTPFINQRGLITLFITHTHPDHIAYIEEYVGKKENGHGNMYFQRTLEDWAKFDINNRTKFDASISSGLALMACNKNLYKPTQERTIKSIDLGIKRYNNKGIRSQII